MLLLCPGHLNLPPRHRLPHGRRQEGDEKSRPPSQFEAVRAEAAGKSPIFDLIFSKIVVFDSKSVIFASNVGLISFPFEKLKLLLTKPIVNMGIEEEPVSDSEKVSMKSSKFAKSLFNHLF